MMILRPYRTSNYIDSLFSPLINYREFDRFFDTLFEPVFSSHYYPYKSRERDNTFYIEENENEVTIIGELPKKLNKDLIKIELEKTSGNNTLLHINIKFNKQMKNYRGRVIKTYESEMKRSFNIDENSFDINKINARIEDGRLYINLPRKIEENNKQIEIPIEHITNEGEVEEREEDKVNDENQNKEEVKMDDENEEKSSFKVEIEDEENLESNEEEEEIAIVSDVVE